MQIKLSTETTKFQSHLITKFMKKKSLLDSIDVPAPCDKSWDEMFGDDVSRFCLHCEKDIYNISAMTRKEAKKLLFQSKEKVCIRMEREADGRIKTLKKQLHQITRQVPLAAGVLTAALILSGTTNAQEQKGNSGKITITQTVNKTSKPIISGTTTDSQSALVAGIKIILRNTKDGSINFTVSNVEGFYEFRNVEASNYEIEISEQSGFKKLIYEDLIVENDKKLEIQLALESQQTTDCFVENNIPVTTETPPIDEKITYQQVVDLPKSPFNPPLLGFPAFAFEEKKKNKTRQIKTSQISFTVYGLAGRIIPNAKVILTKQITNEEFTVISNQEGIAEFGQILRGNYELKVIAPNFQSFKQIVKVKKAIEPNIKVILTAGTIGEVIFIKKP